VTQQHSPSGEVEIAVDETIFSEAVVLKASYWLTADYRVSVRRVAETKTLLVCLSGFSTKIDESSAEAITNRFHRDLIDFRTRQIISDETRTIRDLLVAKAFASDSTENS